MKKQKPAKSIPVKKPIAKKIPVKLTTRFPFKPVICFSVIGIFTFILYFNSLFNNYALDDDIVIRQNMFTEQGWKGVKGIMTHDVFVGFFKTEKNLVAGGRYRPLSLVTFALEHDLWTKLDSLGLFGTHPTAAVPKQKHAYEEKLDQYQATFSHFINMVLYALTGIALFIFLTRVFSKSDLLKGMTFLPLLSTLLYIAHPLHTEAVTNIKGRDEVMGMLFAILAGDFFMKYYDSEKMLMLLWGAICYSLSLLSKENAITWLAIIPLLFYFFREFKLEKALVPLVVTAVVAGIYIWLRQTYTKTSLDHPVTEILNNCYAGATPVQKYATIIYTLGKYLLLFIFPHPLTHDYNFNQIPWKNFSNIWVLLSMVIWGAFTVIAIMQFRKKGLFSFCFLFFASTFSVVSNIFFNVGTTMSERLVYMASLSFCIYAAYLLLLLADFISSKQEIKVPLLKNIPAIAIISLILLGFSIKTIARNPVWKDNYTLSSTDINTSPNSAKLNNFLGGVSLEFLDKDIPASEKRRYTDQAIKVLTKAHEIYHDYNSPYLLLGNAYVKGENNYEKGVENYILCLSITPYYPDGLKNIAFAFGKMKNDSERIAVTKRISEKYPDNAVALYYYGNMCQRAHRIDSAIRIQRRVTAMRPDYSYPLNDLGLMYGQNKNMLDSSIYYLEKAVKADPNNEDANDNLAIAYSITRRYNDAIQLLLKAIEGNPGYAKYYDTLGRAYGNIGNKEYADYYLKKARELDPESKKH